MKIQNYILNRAQKLGANDVIVTNISGVTKQIKFVNNEIVLSTIWDYDTIDIFLACKNRLSSTSLILSPNKISEKNIDNILKNMVKTAAPKQDYLGVAEGPFKYKDIKDSYDSKIENLEEKNVEFVEEAINKALEQGAKRCSGTFYSKVWEIKKVSSNNIESNDNGTSISLSLRAFSDKNASGHSTTASRTLKKFDPKKVGEEAGTLSKESLNPSEGEAGKYEILFHPMAIGVLLNSMSYAFSAFNVDAGASFFIDKLCKKVGSDLVTIMDDGSLDNGFGSFKFDDEGRPTQKTVILDRGVLNTYLHNTSTAKKFNTKSTSNAGLIEPHPWNIILDSGDHTFDEMVSEIKNGIYVTNIWYTRFSNYRTGDFSTIPRDAMFEIKNGRITRPIKGLRLTDNMLRVLENTIAVSKYRTTVQWEFEIPIPVVSEYILCKDLKLTKSAK
jgi:PmbA protein